MKIQVFYPASVRFGEREMYTLLRQRGIPQADAVRAIEQRRGDRNVQPREIREQRVGAI